MQDEIALERKTKEELKQIAMGLEIPKLYAMKKEQLIEAIREKRRQIEEEKKKQSQPKRHELSLIHI